MEDGEAKMLGELEGLLGKLRELRAAGVPLLGLMPDGSPGIAQRISWAFGQTAIENPSAQREHAEQAVFEKVEKELCELRAEVRDLRADVERLRRLESAVRRAK